MKNLIYYFLLSAGLFYSVNTNGQFFDKSDLEAKIDALIPAQVNDSTPGLVIGIVHKGELVFSKGYGLANISYGIPNDPKMVYNIGSVSKQFLGYAFAMLHLEGTLDIDDPVKKYLENWPKFKHKVTLRHLLCHSSGYREAYTMSNLAGRIVGVDRLSREECLDVVRKQPQLEFIPGSHYAYNSTTWVILAEILEKVTGQSADKWVEKNILQALEMHNTQIESYVGEVILNAAESYSHNKDQAYVNKKSNRAIFGAADIYTSIPDLVKWINNYRTAQLGGKAVNELFFAPYILNNGANSEYAMGIGNSLYRGLKRYSHIGSHEAFLTELSYFPDHDLGIVSISNFGSKAWLTTTKIADLLLEKFMVSPVNTENLSGGEAQITTPNSTEPVYPKVEKWNPNIVDLANYEGDYWSDELETIYHLLVEDEKLTIKHRWLDDIKLEPIRRDVFKTDWGYQVKFVRNKKGRLSGLSIYSNRTKNVFFERRK